jgi:hypothetical protein
MDRVRNLAEEVPEVTGEQLFREGVPVFTVAGTGFATCGPRRGVPVAAGRG